MKILVTGATGFIGNHVVNALLGQGISVIAASRSTEKAEAMPWFSKVDFKPLDTATPPANPYTALGSPDRMIHLAWSGLPNFKSDHHMKENLPNDRAFLSAMLEDGLKHLLVTGTCFEYGMLEGELLEDMETKPENPYGLAKDTLRRELQTRTMDTDVIFQWARLFYMFGPGQSKTSLFSLLQKAIDNGDTAYLYNALTACCMVLYYIQDGQEVLLKKLGTPLFILVAFVVVHERRIKGLVPGETTLFALYNIH